MPAQGTHKQRNHIQHAHIDAGGRRHIHREDGECQGRGRQRSVDSRDGRGQWGRPTRGRGDIDRVESVAGEDISTETLDVASEAEILTLRRGIFPSCEKIPSIRVPSSTTSAVVGPGAETLGGAVSVLGPERRSGIKI